MRDSEREKRRKSRSKGEKLASMNHIDDGLPKKKPESNRKKLTIIVIRHRIYHGKKMKREREYYIQE